MNELESLRAAVLAHAGEFLCHQIDDEHKVKTVHFRHCAVAPNLSIEVPDVAGLREFYAIFAELALYVDEEGGEAAFFVAHPSQWPELADDFRQWLDGVDDDDSDLPDWVNRCIVVGEIPHSGNYLLIATTGAQAGRVFEFEHDGFEFVELAETLPAFITQLLDLDAARLNAIASHLRFMVAGDDRQWWIKTLRDNRGNLVSTAR